MYRKKLSRRRSKKMFRRGANRTQSLNWRPRPMRGGIRL